MSADVVTSFGGHADHSDRMSGFVRVGAKLGWRSSPLIITYLISAITAGCRDSSEMSEAPNADAISRRTQRAPSATPDQSNASPNATTSSSPDAILYAGGGFYSEPSAVYAFRFSKTTGQSSEIQTPLNVPVAPTYLVPVGTQSLFAAIEATPGQVTAFSRASDTGALSIVNQVPSGGSGTTHIEADRTGKWLFLSHYNSGSVSVLSVALDGGAGTVVDTETAGDGAQAHGVTVLADNRHIFVPFKGLDRIGQFKFDPVMGQLTPNTPPYVDAPSGSGPRHLAVHPTLPFAYVVDENSSAVSRYLLDDSRGTLTYIDSVSTVPEGTTITNTGAEIQIAPSGRFIYASNRGHDSIAVFSVDLVQGTLTRTGTVPSGGQTPRMFALSRSGTLAAVANQGSQTVALFRVDPDTGSFERLPSSISVEKPSWVGIVEP